jgi:GTPase Era involved in 16S rRNA processing
MICKRCGCKNNASNKFCTNCGKSFALCKFTKKQRHVFFSKREQMLNDIAKIKKEKIMSKTDEQKIFHKIRLDLFIRSEAEYKNLPIKNIAVCATMSAGKSTFVNALLGRDVLPARNEATTAKITSVYDRDNVRKMIGFMMQDGKINEQCEEVELETIDRWNSSPKVERVYLQGDLDGIKNNGFIVAVHDTPGTNNSGDKSHHDVTMDFLQNNKMDALIFVANSTQLCTNDERILLVELLNKVVTPSNIPVVFILNKADEVDEEKENLSDIQKRYTEYLEEIGFKDPKSFLLSAKAARLLKMSRNERSDKMTLREKRELKSMITEFCELHDFSNGASQNCDSEIETALLRSGLPSVEKYIESLF